MALTDVLTNIFSGGAGSLVKSIGDTVKQFVTTDADRAAIELKIQEAVNSHVEAMGVQAQQELDAQVKEMDSARNREIKINESANASWLSKNVTSVIALSYTAFYFVISIMSLSGRLSSSETITLQIINSVTNITLFIVGYYFGSTKSSAKKDETINSMSKQ